MTIQIWQRWSDTRQTELRRHTALGSKLVTSSMSESLYVLLMYFFDIGPLTSETVHRRPWLGPRSRT